MCGDCGGAVAAADDDDDDAKLNWDAQRNLAGSRDARASLE